MNVGLKTSVFVFGLLLAGFVAGCSHPAALDKNIPAPQTADDKIKMIESNTQLSPQQKQQQIERIRAGR